MRINKEEIKALCEKSDKELWQGLRAIAAENGYTLPEKTPPHEDLERVRSIISGKEKIGLGEAVRILNSYKKRK